MKTPKQLAEREVKARNVWAKRLRIPVKEVALNPDGTNPAKEAADKLAADKAAANKLAVDKPAAANKPPVTAAKK